MGVEINLLDRYPRSSRPIDERAELITEEHRSVARQFGKEFFDGDRLTGYGGYSYHPRFWQETVRRFIDQYQLPADAKILDVGCAKGFMLYDFMLLLPQSRVMGIDLSYYAIKHAMDSVRPSLQMASANYLPYPDQYFDLVTSINTIHNLPVDECRRALTEIQRVTKSNAFITVDAWRNEKEERRMRQWNLTALTMMQVDDWKNLFQDAGYQGDYFWFIAE